MGAVLVGKISVGSHCVVGANAVVLSNVLDEAACVGMPVRIIKREVNHGSG